jgi:TolB-like protein
MPQDRQLAAIMFTDIVGYTALMGKDEEAAFTVLNKSQAIQKPIIEKHRGRLLKEIGDGILASFSSASDAVYCALEIQQKSREHSALKLRVGIHVGDVVFQNNDVFGDGVNIASRIQGLAPVGGILVSEAVQKNVSNKKSIATKFQGEKQLKGVEGPVKTYLVNQDFIKDQPKASVTTTFNSKILWILVPAILGLGYFIFQSNSSSNNPITETESSSLAPSLETSIAVLPFDNFSVAKDENQHLCDGIMEEIINHLAKIESLVVRSRSSVEQYREDRPSTIVIGDQLGISHLLEGSVQVVGDEMKVVVQLIEVAGDRHIWQESYIQPLENIFDVYEEVAQKVADQLTIKLSPAEKQQLATVATDNTEAYELYLKAREDIGIWALARDKTYYLNAKQNLQRAASLDPNFAEAILTLASLYWQTRLYYPDESIIDSVLILSNQAIAIDSKSSHAYQTRATYYREIGENERALFDLQKANQLNPNDGMVNWSLGRLLFDSKEYIFGLQLMDRAERLMMGDPRQFWLYHDLGLVHMELHDKKSALLQWNKMLEIVPNHSAALIFKAFLENPDATLELLEKTLSLDSDNPTSLIFLGRYYTLNKDFHKALVYYSKTEADSSLYIEWNLDRDGNMGLCLWHTGQKQQGERLMKKALQGYQNIDIQDTYFCDPEIRIAGIHALLGNKEEAYKWLSNSSWINAALFDIQQDVWFSNINQEKEFREIVDKAMLEKEKIREEIARLKAAGEWDI